MEPWCTSLRFGLPPSSVPCGLPDAPGQPARADEQSALPSPTGREGKRVRSPPLAGWLGVLQLVEALVVAVAGQQLVVRAFLHDAPLVQDDDAIHIADDREAVRDDD